MSKTVKKVGSLNLKQIVESDKILYKDLDIISELTTFISKSNSFEAEDGCNDDLAMCLVIYAWLVQCCLLYTSPSPRDGLLSRMPSSA